MNAVFSQTFLSTARNLNIWEQSEFLWLLLDAARWIKWISENKKIQSLYNEYILRVSPSNNFRKKERELHTLYKKEAECLYTILNQEKKIVSQKEYRLIVWLTWEKFSDQEINDLVVELSTWWKWVQNNLWVRLLRELRNQNIPI